MAEMVVSYHPTVGRTGLSIEDLIGGSAFFPGGSGLWRGKKSRGPLPEDFPESPVIFVGHNFASERGYAISMERGGEAEGEFWKRLLQILAAAGLPPEACFFTNALMGIRPGKAEGEMPSVPGYKEQCRRFLKRQIEIVRPRAVVALGAQAVCSLSRLGIQHIMVIHPGNWSLRASRTREDLLVGQGQRLGAFLESLDDSPLAFSTPETRQADFRKEKLIPMDANNRATGIDAWGFKNDSRNSFLIHALEQGGKSKEEIRREFLDAFPNSKDKSTFNVFFSDVIRPFGSASTSRCVRIEADEYNRLYLDPDRARVVKTVVAEGILKEVNALAGNFPKKDQQALAEIVQKFNAPRR